MYLKLKDKNSGFVYQHYREGDFKASFSIGKVSTDTLYLFHTLSKIPYQKTSTIRISVLRTFCNSNSFMVPPREFELDIADCTMKQFVDRTIVFFFQLSISCRSL